MRPSILLARNLAWYWRTNLAVVLGVGTAVAVLAGALLVGESVRGSLRDLVLNRLGNVDFVVSRAGFFREELAPTACPIIALEGVATHEPSGRRAGRVQVYGVDERFWKFQKQPGSAPRGREIFLSGAVRQELGSKPGDSILLRVAKPSAIPLESLHGRKEDAGRTLRLSMADASAPEFSIQPQQGDVRAGFVPLARLRDDLGQPGKVNTLLMSGQSPKETLRSGYRLGDLGVKVRVLEREQCLSVETDSALIGGTLEQAAMGAARSLGLRAEPVFTYLVNAMNANGRQIPYSLVTAMGGGEGLALSQWAARELAAKVGDSVSMTYYLWKSDGKLETHSEAFRLTEILPMEGSALDRDLAPEYPGITEADSLGDWDPPFPIDLKRVRPADEEYWKKYRTTPKAIIPLAQGQALWQTRFGKLTSIRIFSADADRYRAALKSALDPERMGVSILAAKTQALEASRGAADFGEYFVYFSFFLMASALLLTGLFFKLGVEQRTAEMGALRALGFSIPQIRKKFLAEGGVLAGLGAVIGVVGALAYCAIVMLGLRTWWVGAVGTKLLSLHGSFSALGLGAVAGMATGLGTIAWTLRGVKPLTPRGMLAGDTKRAPGKRSLFAGFVLALSACAVLLGALLERLDQTAGFFGCGTLLLAAALCFESHWLRSRAFAVVRGRLSLGFRSATSRPGRSVLCVALIASATFLIVSVDAFRRSPGDAGNGSFALMAESVLPLIHDPNTQAGRDALNIAPLEHVPIVSFRLRPGDDGSCLNLYQPRTRRILGAPAGFLKESPWSLLNSTQADGAIPVIADANSLTYSLHLKVGDEFIENEKRFRVVGALRDSIYQSELIISETNFIRVFPEIEGYRFFLLDAPSQRAAEVTGALERALSDYGFDITQTQARLAAYHRVENTYLSTFRSLGSLGLLLGSVGLAAVLLRNVLERRRELALLRAVGYRAGDLMTIVVAENILLLGLGLITGAVCALLAIAPAVAARHGQFPALSIGMLLASVLATGIVASFLATKAALSSPLMAALRSE